ncbi:MAG: PEGA domain-containing protein [Candidatus Sericytochromatia bacterium]
MRIIRLFLIIFIFSFVFKANTPINFQKNNIIIPEVGSISISFTEFTILDDSLEKNRLIIDIKEGILDTIKKNTNILLYNTNKSSNIIDNYSKEVINSNEVINIGQKNNTELVLSGSITKLNLDIILNLRIYETVSGKVIFSKQYFSKDYKIKNIIQEFEKDFNDFLKNINNNGLTIFSFGTGKSTIKIRSIPSNSKISVNGIEIGKPPIIIKNIAERTHLLEAWRETDSKIKEINIYPEDEQPFLVKVNDKVYKESAINFSKITEDNFNFEIVSNPYEKNRTNELKYENRKFRLEVITEPENVQVTINNNVQGFSPIILETVFQGTYKIKINKKIISVFKKYIDTSKNNNEFVDFNLFRFGKVFLSSNPQGAEIMVNGEKAGITPKTLELPIGDHILELNKNGFVNKLEKISLKNEKYQNLLLNLTSLKNSDATIAFFPTGFIEDGFSLSGHFLSLSQYTTSSYYEDDSTTPPPPDSKISFLTGGELSYGIKDIFTLDKYLNLGLQGGVFYNNFGTFAGNYKLIESKGIALKLQLIKQGDFFPVSLTTGSYYDFDKNLKEKFNFFTAITKDFGELSTHLGLQFNTKEVTALNLGVSYEGIYRVKIAFNSIIDFRLFTKDTIIIPENLENNKTRILKIKDSLSPLLGISIGYNFL